MKLLSIVVPAYNEEAYLARLLEKIGSVDTRPLGFEKEILVINDGSKDRTEEIAQGFAAQGVTCFTQVPNQGKGKAVQRGIREARGDYVLIQDADLEYDPDDYLTILSALKRGDVVYGSRTLGQLRRTGWNMTPGRHPKQGLGPWLAGVVLSCWTFVLYGQWITDTLTAYKLYPAAPLKAMQLQTSGFETDHEITVKMIRQGLRIVEVPIAYHPRSAEEGKKIKASDGIVALWTLLRYRF
jgi:dolichol-phosphate mannosyltransferase